MARISSRVLKIGLPSFTAEIRLQGYPHTSKTFRAKTEAKQWAKLTEAQMLEGRYNGTLLSTQKRLKDAIIRFLESPTTNKSWLKQRGTGQCLNSGWRSWVIVSSLISRQP